MRFVLIPALAASLTLGFLANSTSIAAATGALLAQRATAEALARLTALVAAMDEAGAAAAMESHRVQGKERFLAVAADDLDE